MDAGRSGWERLEGVLTPDVVRGGGFTRLWTSPALANTPDGRLPRLYASPLFLGNLKITAPPYNGNFDVVIGVTNNNDVYAINAGSGAPLGSILWQVHLGTPIQIPQSMLLEGPVYLGAMGTPIADTAHFPKPRLFVAAVVAAGTSGEWRVFALDLDAGAMVPGWPVPINNTALNVAGVNKNGPGAGFEAATSMSQRGALNLNAAGTRLYVPFGGYADTGCGWLVALDTTAPAIASAFSSGRTSGGQANGGLWGLGGAAVDADDKVYVTTGNSGTALTSTANTWGESLLKFDASVSALAGSYTPANYVNLEVHDIDVGSSSPLVFDLDAAATDAPKLVAFGGKQGTVYLVNRDTPPGGITNRTSTTAHERSFLPPGAAHPLNVFGPDSDLRGNLDYARMRSALAYFKDSGGGTHLFVAGASKQTDPADGGPSMTSVPPSLVRLGVVPNGGRLNDGTGASVAGHWPYLAIEASNPNLVLRSAGSPVLSSPLSDQTKLVVWVLSANVNRGDSQTGATTPRAILYALDYDLNLLWNSANAFNTEVARVTDLPQLGIGGKYAIPAVAKGRVYVGTDRVEAFGLPATAPIVLTPTEDAYVRNGTFATTNFGSQPTVIVKTDPSAGFQRNAYLRFPLAAVSTVTRATLRLCGAVDRLDAATAFDVHAANDSPAWTEASITFANQPNFAGTPLTGMPANVQRQSVIWYEVDVTAYVQARKAGGFPDANLALHAINNTNTLMQFNSRESALNKPQLVVQP